MQCRNIRPVFCRRLYSERDCSMRRCAARRPRNFRPRPGSEFRTCRRRHHRTLRTAALHGVHRMAAGRHSQHGHRRKSYEQTCDEFGESPHLCDPMIPSVVTGRLRYTSTASSRSARSDIEGREDGSSLPNPVAEKIMRTCGSCSGSWTSHRIMVGWERGAIFSRDTARDIRCVRRLGPGLAGRPVLLPLIGWFSTSR